MIKPEQIPDEVVDAADRLDNTRLIIAAALIKWLEIGEALESYGIVETAYEGTKVWSAGTGGPEPDTDEFPALILRLRS